MVSEPPSPGVVVDCLLLEAMNSKENQVLFVRQLATKLLTDPGFLFHHEVTGELRKKRLDFLMQELGSGDRPPPVGSLEEALTLLFLALA